MPRILKFVLVIVVAIAGVAWYLHWARVRALNSGEVYVREQPGATAKPAASTSQPAQPQDQATDNPDAQNDQSRAPLPGSQNGVYTLPAADTISRNPPNQTVIAGTGRFALYRQGDITWRMDTETGRACVLFATEAMWRRTIVYDHGCGAN